MEIHGKFMSSLLRHQTPLGTLEYYAIQVKAVAIHGTSSKSGNIAELVSQAIQALMVSFVDELDNERKRLDKFIIVTNKEITSGARHLIGEAMEGRRNLVFLDCEALAALVKKHNLVQYILFADLGSGDV